ncbi:PilS cassette [Neisseria meningitidis serogroup B]|uniref:PilS cassette n=1 Tax=Neisseria meningitidis serogroup B TaxID=491 RepID=A0A0H5QG06_NEIMI|nr:PilS cassette [Neisseria meningitidis serogroup B]
MRSFIGKAEIAPPSFPRKRESEHVRRETYIPSFPRKWESRTSEFSDNL